MDKLTRKHLLAIFQAGLAAVDPIAAVRRHVAVGGAALRVGDRSYDLQQVKNVFVVGAGKAAAQIAKALEDILGDRVTRGWVNVKAGHGTALKRVQVHEAGHPLPDERGLSGAREIVRILRRTTERDLVLCVLTGGASALMPLPADGVSLGDKQALTQQLLACGANIHELNTVRKHLSQLKGGQLVRLAAPAPVAALILSDVIGDPLDTIASGPTAPDTTTYAEALDILRCYDIAGRTPSGALAHLAAGARGEIAETPKPGDPLFLKVNNLIVANNGAAVDACRSKAETFGYRPLVLSTTLDGEAREVARVYAALAREILGHGRPVAPPACIIGGGETTVTVRGTGLGGRNQEFALAAAIAARGLEAVTILAAGTDGTDGPTDAAGAFADGASCTRAEKLGLSAVDLLAQNDSYRFLDQMGDLLKTGPTGTNVMDLYLLLVRMP